MTSSPGSPPGEQASFEPLNTRPSERTAPAEGVFRYLVHPERDAFAAVAQDDAARLATWIHDRIASGSAAPGDFLVLTRNKRSLATYARALEGHAVPVQVTGAGVGVEHELEELLVLLECMIDPTDPVKVVATLVGLFFGLDHQRLVDHRMAGGNFDVMRPGGSGVRGRAGSAGRAAPLVAVGQPGGRGRLPAAASCRSWAPAARGGGRPGLDPGGRAGLRVGRGARGALAGDASLPGALAALRSALEVAEAEAPLEPGRATWCGS